MSELIGKMPEGVSVGYPPWPAYEIPAKIQKAVEDLHNSLCSKRRSAESTSSENVASSEVASSEVYSKKRSADSSSSENLASSEVYSKKCSADSSSSENVASSEFYSKKCSADSSSSENVASSEVKGGNYLTDTANMQYMFVLLWKSGGPYREKDAKVVGIYSSKKLAVEGAKIKFEVLSNGCYKDGRWTEPHIFEKVVDSTSDANGQGDDIVLLKQVDQEGEYEQLNLQKLLLDEPIEKKPNTAKLGRYF
jgi:hypothetical protein